MGQGRNQDQGNFSQIPNPSKAKFLLGRLRFGSEPHPKLARHRLPNDSEGEEVLLLHMSSDRGQ